MKNLFLLVSLFLISCCSQTQNNLTSIYPRAVTAFGFVVCGSVHNDQVYFVPLKDSTTQSVKSNDFKTEALGTGFLFSASSVVRKELGLLDSFKITNQLRDKRLVRQMGNTLYIPVRIVYEADPAAPDTFAKVGLSDTISLGEERYKEKGRKVKFVVHFISADVLKIGKIAN